ncbi:hypothetical protein CHS0354_021576 [Potamilus streckersoni]|uniref:Ganglioside-induced differentiation-associated protein 1 n=1 Tax=Potamilus streckersoni TaxID=2493646 RepID=A0AAE0T6X8_9BIVA|nr:hypothetical protein CHS0354_021576 [Potamilus streckersoni]
MAGEKFTLYFYPMSYYSQKALHTLFEKGVSFKRYYVDIQNGAQNETWYLKINPKGLVPVLQDGNKYISESEDIIDYLDKEITSGPRLVPDPATPYGQEVARWRKLLHDVRVDVITYGTINNPELSATGLKMPWILRMSKDTNHKRLADTFAKNKDIAVKNPEFKKELEAKNQRVMTFLETTFNKETVSALLDGLEETFNLVEAQLKISRSHSQDDNTDVWLMGPEFTAPDIIMTTLLNRLDVLGLEERYTSPNKRRLIYDYHQRLLQRPAVKATLKETKLIIWIKLKGKILNAIPYVVVLLAIGAAGWGIYGNYLRK